MGHVLDQFLIEGLGIATWPIWTNSIINILAIDCALQHALKSLTEQHQARTCLQRVLHGRHRSFYLSGLPCGRKRRERQVCLWAVGLTTRPGSIDAARRARQGNNAGFEHYRTTSLSRLRSSSPPLICNAHASCRFGIPLPEVAKIPDDRTRYLSDNSAGWHLATNSFHQHVRMR